MTLTPASSRIQSLIQEVAGLHTAFPREIEGCTEEEVLALQRVLGITLPAPYAEFLRAMGRATGGLAPFEADYRLGRLLEFHASRREPYAPEAPLPVGIARWGPFYAGQEAIDFPIIMSFLDGPPRLVAYVPWERGALYPPSVSFLNLAYPTLYEAFFVEAVLKFHLPGLRHGGALMGASRDIRLASRLDALLRLQGFERHPESDCIGYYFRQGATALVNNDLPWLRVTLAAEDAAGLRKLTDTLQAQLPLSHAPF